MDIVIVICVMCCCFVIDNGPEIFEKRALDTKADIYSLGVCMIEIITRSEPYAECKG